MPVPQPGLASEVLSCSPFPEEEQAVAAHRPASPVTVASQSLQTGSSTTQMQESSASIADETSSKKFWSRTEVVQLLEIYRQKRESFKDPKIKNKIIWDEIARIMKSKGFHECDAKACETKFKNLKRSYMTCVDHNNKSGNNPMRKCAYFDEMHDIFHDDDTVRPVALFSSRKGSQKRSHSPSVDLDSPVDVDSCESTSETGASDRLSDLEENKVTKKKRKVANPKENTQDLVSLFKEFTHSREESEKEKLKKIEEMHNEKMAFMGRFLQAFEKSLDKN